MVASSFMFDSMDYIINVEFNIAGRQDVTITFVEPRSRRALHEVLSLPGVLRAESFRAVGVKLKAGHRSERNSLVGLEPGATLNRKIDDKLRAIPVPGHGLMMSRKLAENLDIRVGQMVRVEALEGRRQTRDIVVAGLVDDFFGTGVFASIDVVNRLMLEGPVVSGAYLDVDQARLPELHDELKRVPGVAGTMLRDAAAEIFNRTLAENLYKIISFNILFACMIAFGVVYNSARISQAERARELASLRVIGFTSQEVRRLLAAEFGFVLVIALPLGCVMGRGLAWLITLGLDRDLYRVPLVIDRPTYGMAVAAVLFAALVSGYYVGRKSDRMDLVAVLKTRE
jgi:putative ABC transport system permease protein